MPLSRDRILQYDHGREDYYIKRGFVQFPPLKQKRKCGTLSAKHGTGHFWTRCPKVSGRTCHRKPVKQPAPKIDKSNAVNFRHYRRCVRSRQCEREIPTKYKAIRTLERWRARTVSPTRSEQQDFITVCWLGRACRYL